MNRHRPIRRFHLCRPPAFFRNHAVHFEIFGTRTKVEPFSLFQNNAANLSAVTDPISENWNEGDLLFFGNAREDRRAPHRDVGKVVFAGNAFAKVSGNRWVLMKKFWMPMSIKWSSAKVIRGL